MPSRRATAPDRAPTRSARAAATDPDRDAAPPLDPARARAAATAIGVALALLALLRAALAFAPGSWMWSLSLLHHLAPIPGWGLWALAAIAFVPALAVRLAPALARAGDAIADAPGRATAACAIAAAALSWLLPDRVRFVGDSLLRQRTLAVPGIRPEVWYPQALPLDLAIHHQLAKTLMVAQAVGPDLAAREIGAVESALMAALAIAFARAVGARGIAAFGAAAAVFWSGALTLFTGYNKGFAEMGLLIAALAVAGVRVIRRRESPIALGVLTAIALVLHRSAVGVLPAFALAWWLSPRARADRVRAWIALAIPVAVLAALAPRLIAIATGIDRVHFAPDQVHREGVFAAAFGGLRSIDMLNLILMLAPAALIIPAAWLTLGRAAWRRESTFLAVLALPFVLMIPFVHATQGLFRDWDDFVTAGVGVSMLAAWLIAAIERAPSGPTWLALPLALAIVTPTLQWLAIDADLARGLARVRTFVEEPPARPAVERTATWLYLGMRYLDDRDPRAADAYAEAARLERSPHVLRQWAAAEMMRGRLDRARAIWLGMIARDPKDVVARRELLEVEVRRHDARAATAAADSLLSIDPGNQHAQQILEAIRRDH
jgi:hypothetical protein